MKIYFFYFFLLMGLNCSALAQTTYTVINTNDSGAGSFRQAIIDSNNDGVASTINFNIAGTAPFIIQPLTILPLIADDNTTIDGTANGYALGDIVIDGTLLSGGEDGLRVDGSNFTLLGLVVQDFPRMGINLRSGSNNNLIDGCVVSGNGQHGIFLKNSSFNIIQNCIIGLDVNGSTILGNGDSGIKTESLASNNIYRDNVISGNTNSGIYLTHTSDNLIEGCFIGTDGSGTDSRPNGFHGIRMDRGGNVGYLLNNNIIQNNVISGNGENGIYLSYVVNSIIQNNIVGLNVNGNNNIGNYWNGLYLSHCDSVNITDNTISGNGNTGISFDATQNCTITKNIIGLDQVGDDPHPNNARGIFLNNSCNNITIGGPSPTDGNIISTNGSNGGSSGISIIGNATNILIQHNYIGTDITGTKAKGNLASGIAIYTSSYIDILDNLISDNNINGIACFNGANNINIERNKIGVKIDGVSALGNGQHGIYFRNGITDVLISENIIAHHPQKGIYIDNNNSERIQILDNELFCNDVGIHVNGTSNNSILAPVITFTNNYQIGGTAQANTNIELFVSDDTGCSGAVCQGKTSIGTVTTDTNGDWLLDTFPIPLAAGTDITAIATDALGNSSEFASCFTLTSPISVGSITGCDFLCTGNTSYTYDYPISAYAGINSYFWSVSPSSAANIVVGQYTSQITLTFPDPSATTVTITADPQGGSYPNSTFTITLDTACVWPGDVNYDGIVDSLSSTAPWVVDAVYLSYLSAKDFIYGNSNSNYVPLPRPTPCIETGLNPFDWGSQASASWGATFTNQNGDLVDFKHADCNGNGIIESFKTPGYDGSTPLFPNATDADIVMRYYYLNTPPHNGNNFKQQTSNNLIADINITNEVDEDYILPNGNEARMRINLGSATNQITDVHSISFIVEFEMGTFQNPGVLYRPHLDVPSNISKFQYPALVNNPNNKEWYITMGRKDLTGVDFAGQDLCGIECIITIPNFKTANNEPIPVKVRIKAAAIVHSDGSFEEIEGGSTTLYILPSGSNPPVTVHTNTLLEGTFNATTSLMETQLEAQNLLPTNQPYNVTPWNYSGTETITNMPSNAVDWVLIELRNVSNPAQIIAQKAALLLSNGRIVDPLIQNGNAVYFYNLPNYTSCYLSIRHRNHLAVMSATPVAINNRTLNYNFTDSPHKAMSSNQLKEVDTGTYALHCGDLNSDGIINLADYNFYRDHLSSINTYSDADVKLNGVVSTADFNAYRPNASVIGNSYLRY